MRSLQVRFILPFITSYFCRCCFSSSFLMCFFNTLPTQAVRLPVDRNDGLYDTAKAIWFSLMRNFHTLTGEMYKSESETCHR